MANKDAHVKKNKKKTVQAPPGANGYFLEIADRIGKAKWITIFLLIAVMLLCVIFARGELSLYNFKYLLKHFDVNSEDNAGNFSTLRYDSDGSYAFGYYKDDLILASSTGLDFYDMRGSSVLSESHSMSLPKIVTTDNYLYVYDQGNNSYSVYDSFFGLKSETLDYPISKIVASDSGTFAIISKSLEYRSAVYILDKNFNTKSEVFKDKLVMDAAFSADGSLIAILSCETTEDGVFFAEVQALRPGKTEAEFTVTVEDCYPVSTTVFANGDIGVLASDRFMTFNSKGETTGEYLFGERAPTGCDYHGDYAVLSFNESVIGVRSEIVALDTSAKAVMQTSLEGQVKKLKAENSYAYAMLTDAVARINVSDGEVVYEYTESNPLDFIIRDEQSLLLCYSNRTQAVLYAFSGLEE